MKKALITFFCAGSFFLAGCSTPVDVYHNACMENQTPFAEQVSCVRGNVATNRTQSENSLVNEYLLTGDLLAKDVAAGRISEDQARLLFLKKLNEIKERELQIMAEEAKIRHYQERHFPSFTSCRKDGNTVNCTNY